MKRPGTTTYPKTVGPWELEPHYSRHVGAMTSEGLHDKQDIAFQLALRDDRIEQLEAFVAAVARGAGPKPFKGIVALSAVSLHAALATLDLGKLEKLEDARPYLDEDGARR